ncbi:hypothetical protein [Streptomyces sp. NPDC002467]|uniref:hypothetical protein n=1 Tax=Streptomyces sp. NPDC002467 TaxID=3364647 RepID=UPI003693FA75
MSENPSAELVPSFLHQLMGGPRRGCPAEEAAWREIVAVAGTPVPSDFRAFVDCYGGAILFDHLFVPRLDGERRLVEFIQEQREIFLDGLQFLDEVPQQILDNRNLVIPWAYHDWDGDVCLLVPSGAPGDWDVAVAYRQCPEIEVIDGGFTGFLAGVLKKRYIPRGWPIWEQVWEDLDGN